MDYAHTHLEAQLLKGHNAVARISQDNPCVVFALAQISYRAAFLLVEEGLRRISSFRTAGLIAHRLEEDQRMYREREKDGRER